MKIDFIRLKKIDEGKTKIIYNYPENSKYVYMVFKDDITAGDGEKHDVISGKGKIDWHVNCDIFEFLKRMKVKTHYIESPEERVSIVRKLDKKINLEVVSRRVAAGSILKWGKDAPGTRYDPPITQFHYKDDMLHDPMLDQNYIDYLIKVKGSKIFSIMKDTNQNVFSILEKAFSSFNIQLVDIKLEYGLIDSEVYLIDEITGGSFRLWPYAHPNPDLMKDNIMNELNPDGRLDKDIYRMGEGIGKVKERFVEISNITKRFDELTF
ncbi:MAG: phosphoribosylaminoimidazolesuccinocarboxamide synthase [Thermodesulfobacteriota bacterium]|nr:phosphoribosylaminoimidazolesuccinocarboxamide synthase [Thermodesulfobacteriota bacterium]